MSSISSGTTLTTALVQTADTSGVLQLQTNGGTTALTLDTSQNATFAGKVASASSLQLATNGTTTAVTIDTNQNVGLGVTPSAWAFAGSQALQIKNAGFAGYSNRAYMVANNYFSAAGSSIYIASDFATQYVQQIGQHVWYTAPSGTAGNAITFTQAMTLDTSGNLLVAGTSPTGINSGGGFYVNANSLQTYTMTSHVSGTGSGAPYAYFYLANAYLGQISQSGTTGVNFTSASDYRLKNVSGALIGYKERLLGLQPKQGSWKSDGSEFRGFLAHEFADQYPASVVGEKDAVDEEGNPKYQSMQAGSAEVIADLVSFIQELSAQVTTLQTQVTALKG